MIRHRQDDEMPWSREFEQPISLPGRKPIATFEEAATFIQRLPKAEQSKPHWQAAVEALIMAAESKEGPTMLARIRVMRALNQGVDPLARVRLANAYGLIRWRRLEGLTYICQTVASS